MLLHLLVDQKSRPVEVTITEHGVTATTTVASSVGNIEYRGEGYCDLTDEDEYADFAVALAAVRATLDANRQAERDYIDALNRSRCCPDCIASTEVPRHAAAATVRVAS